MKEQVKAINWRRTITGALVIVLLFVFPAIAWFALDKGLDYRKELKASLKNLGTVSAFTFKNQNNVPVSPDVLRGKVSVVHFLTGDAVADKMLCDRMAKVHQSFDDTKDVLFLTFLPADSTINLQDEAGRLGIQDSEQWYLLPVAAAEVNRLAATTFHLDNPAFQVAIADTSLQVRNVYDLRNDQEMGRLVEHVAVVIPKQKR